MFVLIHCSLGTAQFCRALASGDPHCTHGCAKSCWELIRDDPPQTPPSFVMEASESNDVSGDRISYRYGTDTPQSPDQSHDSVPGVFSVLFVFDLFSFVISGLTFNSCLVSRSRGCRSCCCCSRSSGTELIFS